MSFFVYYTDTMLRYYIRILMKYPLIIQKSMHRKQNILNELFKAAFIENLTEMSQYNKGRRRPHDHFDGAIIGIVS